MLSDQYAETIIVWLYIQKPAVCAKSKGQGSTSWALMGLGHIGWRSLIYPWHFHKILAHRRYPDLFPRVDASKYHMSGDLKWQQFIPLCFWRLETEKTKVWTGWFLPETQGECVSDSLLASSDSNPRSSLTYRHITPVSALSSYSFSSGCFCVFTWPSCKGPVIGFRACPLFQDDLILTNYICKRPYLLIRSQSQCWASLVAQMVKNSPAMQETRVWSLGREDPLEKRMATHSSILAWEIPWTEEPGWLQFMGSQRVGHDWVTNTFTDARG